MANIPTTHDYMASGTLNITDANVVIFTAVTGMGCLGQTPTMFLATGPATVMVYGTGSTSPAYTMQSSITCRWVQVARGLTCPITLTLTHADGLPVELMEFSVEPEEAGEGEAEETNDDAEGGRSEEPLSARM